MAKTELINDIRISIQDAHSIMKVLEHLACIGDDCSREVKDLYWAILYDCAKNIKLRLKEYSCGFVPADPFDEDDCSIEEIIRGLETQQKKY